MVFMNPDQIKREISQNPTILKKIVKENPALLNYIMSDAEIRRKYVKVPLKEEKQLKEAADKLGLAEGALIGLGIILLLAYLFSDKNE